MPLHQQEAPLTSVPQPPENDQGSVRTSRVWSAAAEPGCCPRERPRAQRTRCVLRRTVVETSGTTPSLRRRTAPWPPLTPPLPPLLLCTGRWRTRYGGEGKTQRTEPPPQRDQETLEQNSEDPGLGQQRYEAPSVHQRELIPASGTKSMTSQLKVQVRRRQWTCWSQTLLKL